VVAAALGGTTVFDARPMAAVLAGATAAIVLLSLALTAGRSAPIPFALLLLGAVYAIPHGERAIPTPIYGGVLLLTAELAHWSLEERALNESTQASSRSACSPSSPSPVPPFRRAPSCSLPPRRMWGDRRRSPLPGQRRS
jgi:hypothetical protein